MSVHKYTCGGVCVHMGLVSLPLCMCVYSYVSVDSISVVMHIFCLWIDNTL